MKRRAVCLSLAACLCLCAAGCRRKQPALLTASQVHQVTQELAKAASDASAKGTVVRLRRRNGLPAGGADDLYVGLYGSAEGQSRVLQALEGVATQHRLTVDAPEATGNTTRITLRRAGSPTHHIAIELLGARTAEGALHPTGQARLAVLLDDLGGDRAAAEAIFALHVPITISVLPYHAHSQEIAKEAREQGCEVMLHLPMQAAGKETPEAQELRPGLSRQQVEEMVTAMFDAVPEADGVNNHQGSQATADSALMGELMPVLRDAGMFYVDSRTTAGTVAYDTARRNGVRSAFRNVPFLDDVQTREAVKRQLATAIHGAKEKGEAIAIGHPHPATLEALKEMLPEARKQGVRLVLVSELVH